MDGQIDGRCKKFVYQTSNYGESKFQQSRSSNRVLLEKECITRFGVEVKRTVQALNLRDIFILKLKRQTFRLLEKTLSHKTFLHSQTDQDFPVK
jgi:hypothetical protein